MRGQSTSRRSLALAIGFPLACVVLTIAVFKAFGGATPLAPHGYRVDVPLPNAQSLLAGSDVRTSGVKIGKVVAVRRSGNRALATIELESRFVPMRSGAAAIFRAKTLLGEGYLEIAPSPSDAAPIPEDGSLPADRVRSSVTLDEFLSTFSARTRQDMRSLFAGMGEAFGDTGPALNDTLAYSAPLTSDLNTVLRTIDGQSAQLQRLFASSGDVLDALGRRTGALEGAITSADDLLDITARRNRELAATVHALPPFLRELRATSEAVAAASPDLDRAAASAMPVVAPLQSTVDRVIGTAPAVRAVFRGLRPAIEAGRRGLPALTQIVRATPVALRELYPALREVIPLAQMVATYREASLIGPMATVAAGLNRKLVGPGGKIITGGGGTLYFANESVGGWVKRLPSDRSNPYPKPDRLEELATRGYLTGFDCTHLNNSEPLPPLGTGVPPCLTQGPWNYRGTTAYFPRLEISPP